MADKIYKKDLAEKLADEFNLTREQANNQVDFIFSQLADYLQKGNDITITNFGSFSLKTRKINNENVKYINFKTAKKTKEKINS